MVFTNLIYNEMHKKQIKKPHLEERENQNVIDYVERPEFTIATERRL